MISLWFWQQNQPMEVAEAQLVADGKLQCVSYSPYYHLGQTPLNPSTFIQTSQIDQDLEILSKRFNCIRIYSVGQGLDYVPKAASKLGMQVYLGAWIGWEKALNDKELDLAISVANQFPHTVKALIVGNEVLLRGEQSEAAMKAYLTKARLATNIPVTYADVWEFWRKHPSLEESVDFVTVHILPYWEDSPQPIAHALDHTSTVMSLLNRTFKKPILIGETGWPSIGRQRQLSEPSIINQATYLRGFIRLAQEKHWDYNLIEAIDQPWKRNLEGTVGGYWGIYNTDLSPKFSFNGEIKARTDGLLPALSAGVGALLFLALSLYLNERRKLALIGLAGLGALFGINAILQTEYLFSACRNWQEWLALGSVTLTGWVAVMSIIWMASKANVNHMRILKICTIGLLLATITASLLLILDGRYRDFPISLYALPAIQLSLGLYLLGYSVRSESSIYYILTTLLVSSAAYCLYLESVNTNAMQWFAINLMLAFTLWPKRQFSTF